jgi:hypothetical protein
MALAHQTKNKIVYFLNGLKYGTLGVNNGHGK